MSFCSACGRQRADNSRFCAGCGHEFGEPAADGGTAPSASATATAPADVRGMAPADVTRWDRPVDATYLEASAAGSAPSAPEEPDPFAAWFAPPAGQPAPPRDEPRDQWQVADTVFAQPANQPSNQPQAYPPQPQAYPQAYPPAYPPPSGPGPGYPPPQGPVPGQAARQPSQPSGGARAALIIVAVLVVLAAGGGAYLFVTRSGNHSALAQPSATPSASVAQTSAGSSTSASTGASTSPTASASASASTGVVSIAPSVGSSAATQPIETVLSHYFQGINDHSYAEYSSALDEQSRAKQTQSQFDSGFGTTADSGMTLTNVSSTGGGDLAATVTFTSHQSPSDSVDNSACNHWTLVFSLVPQSTGGYLIAPNPPGYQPTYSDC